MYKAVILILLIGIGGCGVIKKPLVTIEPALLKAGEDVNAIKNQVEKIEGDMSAIKLDVPELKKLVEANIKLQTDLKADIKAQAEINAKGIAGVNNKIEEVKTTAGRDVVTTQTTTNETALMKYIVYIFGGLCMALITGLITCMKMLIKKDKQKKFYKEKALVNIKDENELKHLREEHNIFCNGGKR